MNAEKVIVTVFGGSGFLGSHVVDQLGLAGYEVRVFDRQHSQWAHENQQMIIGDILDKEAVKKAVDGASFVYNFAAVADLNIAINSPETTMQVNILGNLNILEACRKYHVKRFIYASTVYVNSREGSFYRISKQTSEQLVEEYQQRFDLNYTVLRYGSIYGPRSDEHNGLFRIVKNAIKTGIVKYEGHPESLREYVHVEDVARASIAILDEEFCNESIVLTGQEAMRVYDVLEMLAEIMDIKKPVEFNEKPYQGHYTRTPYAFKNKIGRKYIPSLHVDLGQGLLQLIGDVYEKVKKNEIC
ncbi:NAD(P)-dependent oxidoreductase [bacterium]|nr:NAD(P)-dependent oxidoreductase [bacterium]